MWKRRNFRAVSLSVIPLLFFLSNELVEGRPESPQVQHQYEHQRPPNTRLKDQVVADVSYFSNLNVEHQLANKRFVELQIECLIYDGKCDFFGKKARGLLPSVILNNCRHCSYSQKHKLNQVVVHLQQNYPGAWRDALAKYGGAPKFITALSPSFNLFGKKPTNGGTYGGNGASPAPIVGTSYNPVLPQPESAHTEVQEDGETSLPAPVNTLSASPAPDPIPAVESPTPPMEPTSSPEGFEFTSSAKPMSTSVVESTIEVKPTTIEP